MLAGIKPLLSHADEPQRAEGEDEGKGTRHPVSGVHAERDTGADKVNQGHQRMSPSYLTTEISDIGRINRQDNGRSSIFPGQTEPL